MEPSGATDTIEKCLLVSTKVIRWYVNAKTQTETKSARTTGVEMDLTTVTTVIATDPRATAYSAMLRTT